MRKPKKLSRKFHIGFDGKEFYIEFKGKRIAKRGHPGTPQAGMIPLVEGVSVHDELPDDSIPVFEAGEVQLMPEPKGAKQ
jgi:hypothetical protein